MKLIEETVMEKAAQELMVLKLNFGTKLGEREKGAAKRRCDTGNISSTALHTDSTVSAGAAEGLNRLQEPEQGNANNLSASSSREAHALPFGAEWSQNPGFQF